MGTAYLYGNGGSGGVGGLGFEIVGGTTRPKKPTQNMVWVNTDVDITEYALSAIEPESPVEGMLWVTISDSGNIKSVFTADKEWITVYPISAKQYVNGEWGTVEAKSYQNGEWVEWIKYLYNYGQYFTQFTSYKFSATGVITENSDHVLLTRTQETNSQVYWGTEEKVDLSKNRKLYIEAKCSNVGVIAGNSDWRFRFGAFSDKVTSGYPASNINMLAGTTFTADNATTVYEVPLPADIGEAYVCVRGTGIVAVYKIWWE